MTLLLYVLGFSHTHFTSFRDRGAIIRLQAETFMRL
jgi:hypothetical protein